MSSFASVEYWFSALDVTDDGVLDSRDLETLLADGRLLDMESGKPEDIAQMMYAFLIRFVLILILQSGLLWQE